MKKAGPDLDLAVACLALHLHISPREAELIPLTMFEDVVAALSLSSGGRTDGVLTFATVAEYNQWLTTSQ